MVLVTISRSLDLSEVHEDGVPCFRWQPSFKGAFLQVHTLGKRRDGEFAGLEAVYIWSSRWSGVVKPISRRPHQRVDA